MAEPEVLASLFANGANMSADPLKHDLAYRHMLALADTFAGWSQYPKITPERGAQLLGWAELFQKMADEVGPDWDPPPPATDTLIGFIARRVLGEKTLPPRYPAR